MTEVELLEYNSLIAALITKVGFEVQEYEVEMAIAAIHNYINHPTNTKLDTLKEYEFAVIMVLKEYNEGQLIKAKFGGMGVASLTQGSRSITYKDSGTGNFIISDTLRGLLPVPFISFF